MSKKKIEFHLRPPAITLMHLVFCFVFLFFFGCCCCECARARAGGEEARDRLPGPPGSPESEWSCCVTASRPELKEPGGLRRHFLLYLPASRPALTALLNIALIRTGRRVRTESHQRPLLRGNINGDKNPLRWGREEGLMITQGTV